MILGSKISEKSAARPTTARVDRESAGENHGGWLDRVTAQFRSAVTFQIPMGYQDKTGFYRGVERAVKRISVVPCREENFFHPTQF